MRDSMNVNSQVGIPAWRILLIADSLGLPRPAMPAYDSHAVIYDQTYPYLLSTNLKKIEKSGELCFEWVMNAERARTMPKALGYWTGEGSLFLPKIVLIHVGIVDCAPRVFTPLEHYLVGKVKPLSLQKSVLNFVSRNRRKRILARPKVYTSLPKFAEAASDIARGCAEAGVRLGFISIAPTNEVLAYRSPGIKENIVNYNQVLQNVAHEWGASFIDFYSALSSYSPDEYLLGDGHHLDLQGHVILTDLLLNWVKSIVTSDKRENA
jgi:hypothetical protein